MVQQAGFYEEWPQESFMQRTQSLDIDNPVITETPFLIGFWAIWNMQYEGIPIPYEVAESIVTVLNNQGRAGVNNTIRIYPKYDSLPNRYFEVNYIGGGIKFSNTDSPRSIGNFGLNLMFKLKSTVPYIDIQSVIAPSTYATVYDDTAFITLTA